MKAREMAKARKDIGEAFDFVRFLLRNPKMLRKVRDGAEIRIVPAAAGGTKPVRLSRKVQAFSSETVFHLL